MSGLSGIRKAIIQFLNCNQDHHLNIQGYFLIKISESELDDLEFFLPEGVSLEDLITASQEIFDYIRPADLKELVSLGIPNIIYIPSADQTTMLFENLEPDTYYFSISTIAIRTRFNGVN